MKRDYLKPQFKTVQIEFRGRVLQIMSGGEVPGGGGGTPDLGRYHRGTWDGEDNDDLL